MNLFMIVLTALAILIYFGAAQRVLDRMYLSDRAALALTALLFAGGLLPNIPLGSRVEINLGGGLIPLGVCVFLLIRAGSALEVGRTLLGSVLTAAGVYALSLLLPAEAENLPADPLLLYAACAGLMAFLLGRSRRGAFVCGVLGVLLADTATALITWQRGVDQPLVLGGAGAADAVVVSGVLAVLLTEIAGEITERFARRRRKGSAE